MDIDKQLYDDENIQIMQRKMNLGMNAILSISLAIGRMIAHVQGKDLWQLLREEMKCVVAKAVIANGGIKILKDNQLDDKIAKLQGTKDVSWRSVCDILSFDDLIIGLQKVEAKINKDNIKLYQVLREQMQIYTV